MSAVVLAVMGRGVSAQFVGPSQVPPGGGGLTGTTGSAGSGGGLVFSYAVVHLPCVATFWGPNAAGAITAKYNVGGLVAFNYDPSQTTPTSTTWTATLPANNQPVGGPQTIAARLVLTAATPGVVTLPPGGATNPTGYALFGIPADVAAFSINVKFESFWGGTWVPLDSLATPYANLPGLSGVSESNYTGAFFWWTGGPCASTTILPSLCGTATFGTGPFTLGTLGTAIISGGAPNSPGVIIYSIGPPSPLVIAPCTVYVDLLAFTEIPFSTNAVGSAVLLIPLPFDPAYAGLVIVEQAGIINPAAPLGIDITNANQLLVGY
jgi:hypothetical protein